MNFLYERFFHLKLFNLKFQLFGFGYFPIRWNVPQRTVPTITCTNNELVGYLKVAGKGETLKVITLLRHF